MRVIGVDVGGTFTDGVFVDTETDQIVIYKLPTSAHDPSTGVLTGITELCRSAAIAPASVDLVYRGTSIATNALL